jgi:fermentation-respiration switch protein FrsA (DUF1100 family)
MRRMIVLLSLLGCGLAGAAPKGPEGIWLGALDVGAIKLRLAFHVERKPDGTLTSTVDSIDQKAMGIPVARTTLEGDTLRLELPTLAARFEGKLAGDKLVGTWTQARAMPLSLSRVDKIEPLRRPQTPSRPFPYTEEEVAISVAAAPLDPARKSERITLAGTLTLPPGNGPFPAVVFITGSGPQDRDETILEHRPFLVLADALTRRGIATLRVDDRGVGKSGGKPQGCTTLDFVEDVRAELDWLAERPEINRAGIGVLGHSEGGLIAPIIATKSDRARFVVMLAGTGMTGEQIMYAQNALIERAEGASEEQIKRDRIDSQRLYETLRAAKSDADVEAALRTFVAADPKHKAEREAAAPTIRSPWLRTFLTLDPIPYLEKVRVPVLALSGERDLQVPKENLPLIEAALRRAKNADITARVLPGLNHLFQHAKSGSPSEYSTIEETFAPEAIKLVCDWIADRARSLK